MILISDRIKVFMRRVLGLIDSVLAKSFQEKIAGEKKKN